MALSPISSSLLHSQHNRDQTAVCLDWFGLMPNAPVNSYGHVGTVSSLTTLLSWTNLT